MCAAWPDFVPRIEFDVHLREMVGQIDKLSKKVILIETQHADMRSMLTDLDDRSHNVLATQQALSSVEQRLDLDIAICHQEAEENQDGCRMLVVAETAALRSEIAQHVTQLQGQIDNSNTEMISLDARLLKSVTDIRAEYVNKESHVADCDALQRESRDAATHLTVEVDDLRVTMALKEELTAERQRWTEERDALHQGLIDVSRSLDQTAAGLVGLLERCPPPEERLAAETAVRTLVDRVAEAHAALEQARAERQSLRQRLDGEIDGLKSTNAEQKTQRELLGKAAEEINTMREAVHTIQTSARKVADRHDNEFAALRDQATRLQAQCSKQDFDGTSRVREMQDSHRRLEEKLSEHVEAQTSENERLRQQSTLRYLEQIDKAVNLHQSVKEVEKNHGKLKEAMSAHLPRI